MGLRRKLEPCDRNWGRNRTLCPVVADPVLLRGAGACLVSWILKLYGYPKDTLGRGQGRWMGHGSDGRGGLHPGRRQDYFDRCPPRGKGEGRPMTLHTHSHTQGREASGGPWPEKPVTTGRTTHGRLAQLV